MGEAVRRQQISQKSAEPAGRRGRPAVPQSQVSPVDAGAAGADALIAPETRMISGSWPRGTLFPGRYDRFARLDGLEPDLVVDVAELVWEPTAGGRGGGTRRRLAAPKVTPRG
jgi:hypothetical protein